MYVLLKERARLVAYREPLALEEELLALDDEAVNTILAQNRSLSLSGADVLEEKYPELIAQFYPLDEGRFQRLFSGYSASLALNTSLTPSMQERLMGINDENVLSALANNTELLNEHLETLFALNRYGLQLASNPSLSKQQLEMLYHNANPEMLKALAANTSTPVEILYQLSLDQRTERAVKTNSAFGKHIQTTNLGWS